MRGLASFSHLRCLIVILCTTIFIIAITSGTNILTSITLVDSASFANGKMTAMLLVWMLRVITRLRIIKWLRHGITTCNCGTCAWQVILVLLICQFGILLPIIRLTQIPVSECVVRVWSYLITIVVLRLLLILPIGEMSHITLCLRHVWVLTSWLYYIIIKIIVWIILTQYIMFFVMLYLPLLVLRTHCILLCIIAVYVNVSFVRRGAMFIRFSRWHWWVWLWRKCRWCWKCPLGGSSLRIRLWWINIINVVVIVLLVVELLIFIFLVIIIIITIIFIHLLYVLSLCVCVNICP